MINKKVKIKNQLSSKIKKATEVIVGTVLISATNIVPVFAEFSSTKDLSFLDTSANNFLEIANLGVWAVVVFVAVYIGATLGFGGDQTKERTKKQIPWLLIGTGIIVFGVKIVGIIRYIIGK